MAKKSDKNCCSLPLAAMFYVAIFSALIVGGSFEVIKHWPQPISIVPYFGFKGGLMWGAVVGALAGLVLGYLTDDQHFEDPNAQ